MKYRATGSVRFTRFGPEIFEGHAKGPFEWNVEERGSDNKLASRIKGDGTVEICFRRIFPRGTQALARNELSGDLKRRLEAQAKKERKDLGERIASMVRKYKERRDRDRDTLKRLGEEMKKTPSVEKVLRLQEFGKRMEKEEGEFTAARDEERKRGEDAIRARRIEAFTRAWDEYLKKVPAAPWEAKP